MKASTQALTGTPPQFEIVNLEPMNESQIREMLSHLATQAVVDEILSNPPLFDLMRRPVMSELVLDALPDIEQGAEVDLARVYLYAIRRKMNNDISASRTFTSLTDKTYFLCELSWEMIATDQMTLNYRSFPERLRLYFGEAVREERDLDHWHYDMLGQTMLIRDSAGDYSPAHRSLLEFFVAVKLLGELGMLHGEYLNLLQDDSSRGAEPTTDTWSGYFSRVVGRGRPQVRLTQMARQPVVDLVHTFGSRSLTAATERLMGLMLGEVPAPAATLLSLAQETRDLEHPRLLASNALHLACALTPSVARDADLSRLSLPGLDLSGIACVDFTGANLTDAKISPGDLTGVALRHANLCGADLEGCRGLGEVPDHPTDFEETPSGRLFVTQNRSPSLLVTSIVDDCIEVAEFVSAPFDVYQTEAAGPSYLAALGPSGAIVLEQGSGALVAEFDTSFLVMLPEGPSDTPKLITGDTSYGAGSSSLALVDIFANDTLWEQSVEGGIALGFAGGPEDAFFLLESREEAGSWHHRVVSLRLEGRAAHFTELCDITSSEDRVYALGYDKGRLLLGVDDKELISSVVRVYDLHGQLMDELVSREPDDEPWWLLAAPGTRRIVVVGPADTYYLLSARGLRCVEAQTHAVLWRNEDVAGVSSMHATADGRWLLVGTRYGSIVLLNAASGAVRQIVRTANLLEGCNLDQVDGLGSRGVSRLSAHAGAVLIACGEPGPEPSAHEVL